MCFPLLNAVSKVDQVTLKDFCTRLHQDLKTGEVDTLSEYTGIYHKLLVLLDLNTVENRMVQMLCHGTAEVIELQC